VALFHNPYQQAARQFHGQYQYRWIHGRRLPESDELSPGMVLETVVLATSGGDVETCGNEHLFMGIRELVGDRRAVNMGLIRYSMPSLGAQTG
jgi:hypothetical protein